MMFEGEGLLVLCKDRMYFWQFSGKIQLSSTPNLSIEFLDLSPSTVRPDATSGTTGHLKMARGSAAHGDVDFG